MNTFTIQNRLAARFVAVLAVFSLLMSMVPMQALAQVAPVAPQGSYRTIDGNPSCTDLDADFLEIKLDTGSGEVTNGTFKGITLSNVTVKEDDANEPMTFDWSKVAGEKISAVIVKAGSEAYVYDYVPAVDSDTNLGTQSNQAISHISFCYEIVPVTTTLTLEKDTAGGGDAVASDWKLSALGAMGFSRNGVATRTFTEEEFGGITPTWDLVEEPADPLSSITDNYVAGTWDCDGGALVGNQITLEKGDDVTCTITNTYEAPVLGCTDRTALNWNEDANTDDGSCQYMCAYSDAGTIGNGQSAILTFEHPDWVDNLTSNVGEWIWSQDAAENVTFTKTFFVDEVPAGGTLRIAADNTYQVFLNGDPTPLSCDGSGTGNFGAEETCSAPITQGLNTLTVVASNSGGPNTANMSNPAGLIFEVVSSDSTCSAVEDLGSITIEKVFEGTEWSFDFGGSKGDFTLTSGADSKTFGDLVADKYTFTEDVPENWANPSIICKVGESGVGYPLTEGGDGVIIDLEKGQDVTCTFTNVAPVCEMGENLLKNPSFEEPVVTANNGTYEIFANVANWVISLSDGLELWKGIIAPSDGLQNAELDGNAPTQITQAVPTTPGATYELRFDFAARGTDAADNNIDALVDGGLLMNANSGVTEWTEYKKEFVATGFSTDIAFRDMGTPNSTGSLLDNAVLCLVDEPELPTFTISGHKYNDANENGIVDEDEETIEGWEFELYYDGELDRTTTTNENGYYEFVIEYEEGVNPFLFEVKEVMPNENSGWEMTGLYVDGEMAEACRLPLFQSLPEDEISEVSARLDFVRPQSMTLDCDFLNYREERRGGRSSGTRTDRNSGRVAGDSTTKPEGQVLGDQVSVVPLGAAAAGAGGAAPVELPGLGLTAAAFLARRK